MDMVVPGGKWNSLHPVLEQLAADADGRSLREELCVLYVAMTRAVRRLDLLIPGVGPRAEPRSMANLLRETLGDAAPDTELATSSGARELWRHPQSDDSWYAASRDALSLAGDGATAQPDDAEPEPRPIRLAPSKAPRWMPRVAPSSRASTQRITPAILLRLADEPARVRGLLVHAWLSRMEWLEDYAPSDDELHAQASRMAHDEEITVSRRQVSEIIAEYRAMLRQPVVIAQLSRAAHAEGELEVWREQPFVVSLPDGAHGSVVRGAFDRVVLRREAGRVVAADIVDYKTDALPAPGGPQARRQLDLFSGEPAEATPDGAARSSLDEKAEHYRPQMESYRAVLARLTGLSPAAIRCRLLFLTADQVVDV
jgi:ATP-dependent exoDNAse (exonuclease V) beta subunit